MLLLLFVSAFTAAAVTDAAAVAAVVVVAAVAVGWCCCCWLHAPMCYVNHMLKVWPRNQLCAKPIILNILKRKGST